MKSTRIIFCLAANLIVTLGCSRSEPVEEISVDISSGGNFEKLSDPEIGADDWPWWRGAQSLGTAPDQSVPTTWSATENVLWSVPVPGRGHSSPTVVRDKILLSTADDNQEIQSVVCFDRSTGDQLWKTDVHRGGFPSASQMHAEASHASATVASDGERLFAAFLNDNAVFVTALDLEGGRLWQTEVGSFTPKFGYSASPAIYQSFVIIAADDFDGGFIAAVHRNSGEIVWRKRRPAGANYASPVVASVGGREQILICGCEEVTSYNPDTGDELWSCSGTTEGCVGTMVFQNDLVFASGGYPGSETMCIKADGSAEVIWRNDEKSYVPSLLLHQNNLFMVNGEGRAYCWQADTGAQLWRGRVGGRFRSSPVLAGDHIYAVDMGGKCTVFKATGQKFEVAARNQLGDEAFATPTFCGNQIFLRVASHASGNRQETLYCISE